MPLCLIIYGIVFCWCEESGMLIIPPCEATNIFLEFIFLTILNHIRDIKDPEHPYSLEELKVITEDAIEVDDKLSYVR